MYKAAVSVYNSDRNLWHNHYVAKMSNKVSPYQRLMLEIGRRRLTGRKRRHTLQQLFWECTLRCNLNCRHCGSDCRVDASFSDMTLLEFLSVLDEVSKVAYPPNTLIITTGGEPLVRQDIVECGRQITKRGYMWGMVSNGLLLTEHKLHDLIDAGLRTIAISLDSFAEEHNWMRGNSLSFDRAVNAIKYLTKCNITWDVITYVNQRNFYQLEKFRDFLIDIGVRYWRIFTIFPSGRAKENSEMQLSPENYKSLMDFIVEERKRGKISLSHSCEGFLGKYENKVRDYQYFCQAGINVASILADGSISGCLSIRGEYHQGNIQTHKFSEVWMNGFNEYRARQWMKKGECAECSFWKFCEGNGMHLRESDGSLILCNLKQLHSAHD